MSAVNVRGLVAVAGVVAATLGAVAVQAVTTPDAAPAVSVQDAVAARPDIASRGPRIAEDDPRWQCASMGNGLCGPGPKGRRQ